MEDAVLEYLEKLRREAGDKREQDLAARAIERIRRGDIAQKRLANDLIIDALCNGTAPGSE